MFERILIATDFSEASRPAIGKAVQLGRKSNAYIEIIHVVSDLEDALNATIRNRGRAIEREAELETNLDLALPDEAYPGVVKRLLRAASIPAEIVKHAIQGRFDLIVCGSHGRGLIGRTVLGSVTQELSRGSSVPVLVVPPYDTPSFGDAISTILVPLDFSAVSMDGLDYAQKLASGFNASIQLLHVIPVPAPIGMPDMYPIVAAELQANDQTRSEITAEFERVTKGRTAPSGFTTEIMQGDPAEEILCYATEHDCSCIVMGPHGRKGLARAILGSVTRDVLARTKVPVFTVGAHL